MIKAQAGVMMPTEWGNFKMIAYSDSENNPMPHIAMIHEHTNIKEPTAVRIHSECMTGDLFHSKRCDCGEQLDFAMSYMAKHGGIVLYMRQEGRGIGLINKIKAYQLQDQGYNTIEANEQLGLDVDARKYDIAIAMLKDVGVSNIHLMTNNPLKLAAFDDVAIRIISRIPIIIPSKPENKSYLATKRNKMGHLLTD